MQKDEGTSKQCCVQHTTTLTTRKHKAVIICYNRQKLPLTMSQVGQKTRSKSQREGNSVKTKQTLTDAKSPTLSSSFLPSLNTTWLHRKQSQHCAVHEFQTHKIHVVQYSTRLWCGFHPAYDMAVSIPSGSWIKWQPPHNASVARNTRETTWVMAGEVTCSVPWRCDDSPLCSWPASSSDGWLLSHCRLAATGKMEHFVNAMFGLTQSILTNLPKFKTSSSLRHWGHLQ